jgi:hypothetical protein
MNDMPYAIDDCRDRPTDRPTIGTVWFFNTTVKQLLVSVETSNAVGCDAFCNSVADAGVLETRFTAFGERVVQLNTVIDTNHTL